MKVRNSSTKGISKRMHGEFSIFLNISAGLQKRLW
jgi:hypothetical protein